MRINHLVLLASLALTTSSCSGGGGGSNIVSPTPGGSSSGGSSPSTCTAGTGTVCIGTDNSFNPGTITIAKGSSVSWGNPTGVTHNVTFNAVAGAPTSSANFSSGSFVASFPTAGSYPYHCTIHGLSMSGTVIVQ